MSGDLKDRYESAWLRVYAAESGYLSDEEAAEAWACWEAVCREYEEPRVSAAPCAAVLVGRGSV
jgi:hypothetical protein